MGHESLAIDSQRLFDVLSVIVILSFFVERFLSVVFESRWFLEKLASRHLKEPITLVFSVVICRHWDFDAVSLLFTPTRTQLLGHVLTGGIVAGGSKASIRLFRDLFGAMSNAERERGKARS